VRGILDLARAHEGLLLWRQAIVHRVPGDERRGPERDVELVARAVVVAEGLAAPARDSDGEEGCNAWGVEAAKERSIDVPAEEAGEGEGVVVGGGDGGLVEFGVMRVFEG